MINYRKFFSGKKITLMGLGLLGRGTGDAAFLAKCGARLTVTDLKSAKALAPSVRRLKRFGNIAFRLGGHRLADFKNRDLIIKAAGVPLDSPYLAEARRRGIKVTMSTALFAKLVMAMGVTIIGITGTRGKSTTTLLIYEILRAAGRSVWLGGNVRGISTLALLPKVRSGDIAVLELDSWQLQGFGAERISPQIAVWTNFMPDHMNYYRGDMARYRRDKENIFRWQKRGNYFVDRGMLPGGWKLKLLGGHNRKNAALAAKVGEILGIKKTVIKKVVENFSGVPGRLELVRIWRGIKIYNDTTATTPEATLAAFQALGRKVIWIGGGADKNLDLTKLVKAIPRYCQAVILLPGAGTEKLKTQSANLKVTIQSSKDLKRAIALAAAAAKRGDIILFSPAFTSFGLFRNEFDRGEKFNRLVRRLR